ncbi:hypothetical protein ON010_g13239 [Phytophthora cinnamomi]|nr:hypothetical protein ON010_g13239 [Phytophthora cinnamomi]
MRCACIAAKGDVDRLRDVGAVIAVLGLLRNGSDSQKMWAAETLRHLTIQNEEIRAEVVANGAAGSLVVLMLIGTDAQKQRAVYALGNLVDVKEVISEVAEDQVIMTLVTLFLSALDLLRHSAVYEAAFTAWPAMVPQGAPKLNAMAALHH